MAAERRAPASAPGQDPVIAELAWLFAEHPVWVKAMGCIAEGTTSAVYFSHRPGEAWHLIADGGRIRLRLGPARRPDFAFRFSPVAVETLAGVEGETDDVAVYLFDLILAGEVGFRIIAPFWRLIRHGHLRLVLDAGPKVIVYGAQHGVTTLGQLRALVRSVSSPRRASWEQADAGQ